MSGGTFCGMDNHAYDTGIWCMVEVIYSNLATRALRLLVVSYTRKWAGRNVLCRNIIGVIQFLIS